MPKIFALRDRLISVQQSLFAHEEHERTKVPVDNYNNNINSSSDNFSTSSKSFFCLNYDDNDSTMLSPCFEAVQHEHELTSLEGKIIKKTSKD